MITFIIFRIPVRRKAHERTWDLTTLVLKKAIDKYIGDNEKEILDMGCGHVAILSQYIKKNYGLSNVTGADIYKDFVETAKFNTKKNNFDITVLKSDLYQNIQDKYDYIIFNPPYVPKQKIKMKYKKTKFSGKDGTYITRKFLSESKKFLKRKGKILIGINCFYINSNKMRVIAEECGYRIEDVVTSRFNTSKVFVLSCAQRSTGDIDENN